MITGTGASVSVTVAVSMAEVTGLTPFTDYTFSVTSENAVSSQVTDTSSRTSSVNATTLEGGGSWFQCIFMLIEMPCMCCVLCHLGEYITVIVSCDFTRRQLLFVQYSSIAHCSLKSYKIKGKTVTTTARESVA